MLKKELHRLQEKYQDDKPEADRHAMQQKKLQRKAADVPFEEVLVIKKPGRRSLPDLDPSAKPITVAARCSSQKGDGVILAQGGQNLGYSLYLKDRRPCFAVRSLNVLRDVCGPKLSLGQSVHLVGTLTVQGQLMLYVDGRKVAEAKGHLIAQKPADALSVGADNGSLVGTYTNRMPFQGELRDLRICWGVAEPQQIIKWTSQNN